LLLIGCDFFVGILTVFAVDEHLGENQFFSFVMFFYTAVDTFIAWYFFYHSYLLSIPLLKYLKISQGPTKRLGRIAFSLAMNGMFMVFSTVVHLILAVQCVKGIRSPVLFYSTIFCFISVRAGVAYWNVRIVLLTIKVGSDPLLLSDSGGFYAE
jgi:hypothetical protein